MKKAVARRNMELSQTELFTPVAALAVKGRAFESIGSLVTGQGGHQLLAGSFLVVTATVIAWSNIDCAPVGQVLSTIVR